MITYLFISVMFCVAYVSIITLSRFLIGLTHERDTKQQLHNKR